ncbi:glycosyltransferase [Flavobacterium magnum]|uniref:glycosyltransferase n=1 Tax=Flavobacterium magnum TaxID=2162713 RepID=UPI001C624DE8|nr:glycosyltransferase [Flavobacterium magnum]
MSFGDVPLLDVCNKPTTLISPNATFLTKVISKVRKKLQLFPYFEKKLKAIQSELEYNMVSLPLSEYDLFGIPEIAQSDIVHLHAVHGILDYKRFFSKLNKPLVWTLHDINPVSGIFHLRNDEVLNREKAGVLNEQVLKFKSLAYKLIKHGAVVAPSNWLYREAITRDVFCNVAYYEIPNAVPEMYFTKFAVNTLMRQYGIKNSESKLLFAISDFRDKNKGIDLLIEAVRFVKNEHLRLLIVGNGDRSLFANYNCIDFGYVENDAEMANIYNLADIVILPSRDENLPNVLLESLSCGTPVVSFKVGGMEQYITNGFNGEMAEEITGPSLGKALQTAITSKHLYNRDHIRQAAYDCFSSHGPSEKYKNVYRSLLSSQYKSS